MVLDFIVNLLVLAFIIFLFVNLLCSDSSFEYEFLNSGLSKVYEERYEQVAEYFDE